MRLRSISIAAVFATAVAAVPAFAQQAVLLRYAPPVGQVSHYRQVVRSWIRSGAAPVDTTSPTMIRSQYSTESITARDGDARVVTTRVDSSSMQPAMGSGEDEMRGVVTTQHVDPLGRVLQADVQLPAATSPMIGASLREHARERAMVFPERPVHPGDTWKWADTTAMGGGGTGAQAVLAYTYKLERVERRAGARLVTIGVTAVMSSDTASASVSMNGTMTGEMVLDLTHGRLVRKTSTVNAVIQSPQAGRVPMVSESTTEMVP